MTLLLWVAVASAAGGAVGLAIAALQGGPIDGTLVLISALFGTVVAVTVWLATIGLSPRLRGLSTGGRTAVLGLALLSGAAAGTVLVLYLFPFYILRDLNRTAAIVGLNGVLAVVVGAVVHTYETLRREVQEVRLREARLREEAARAELSALQARIHPHFFFNTLNTISGLIGEDPRKADEVVTSLAQLFRYTFRKAGSETVPFAEEMEFVREYLAIEQARFGDRLRVEEAIDPRAATVPVPALVLQPLVENAVGHGLGGLPQGGTILISARVDGPRLEIAVDDDGAGLASDPQDLIREPHALANVRRRLAALYGEAARLELAPGCRGRGTRARLVLPAEAA